MRRHWENCVTHFDEGVDGFIADYFARLDRCCVLVAGAGFDPRAKRIARALSKSMGDRVHGLFIREDRGDRAINLQQLADENESELKSIISDSIVSHVQIFSTDDRAPVGGHNVRAAVERYEWPEGVTDVVLDMSALSTGVGFPLARLLLDYAEVRPEVSLHVMVVSNPELDDLIVGEPSEQVQFVRGYSGPSGSYARLWISTEAGPRRFPE